MRPFPFTAVVGMDDLRLALVLNALSPAVGGVLVRGEKGTAKSTMVRALTALLPDVPAVDGCRFSCDPHAADPACPDGPHGVDAAVRTRPSRLVELPVGATEDRVLGSLHLERALAQGVSEYEPGLLAAAHRGLLYVDEVNLLHDHLVDVLLDAAAMGRSTVERDGVSVSHAAYFVLVGTMNPEEGELRPQLLDRFGLTVEVAASRDPHTRAEVVRRRLAYEAAPEAFAGGYRDSESRLAERIRAARALLPQVVLDDDAVLRIATICAAFEVDGLRADLVTARAAIAHAAWSGRTAVSADDIRAAARLALPHRRRRNPFDAPGLDEDQLENALDAPDEPDPDRDPDEPDPDRDPDEPDPDRDPDRDPNPDPDHDPDPDPGVGPGNGTRPDAAPPDGAGSHPSQGPGQQPRTTAAGSPYRARLFTVPGSGTGESGRRSRARTDAGRTVGSRPYQQAGGGPVHLVATVRAAAPHQVARGRTGRRLLLRPADLQGAVREGRESNLVLFCVDASGSMSAQARMREVKAAVMSLLLDAYQRRDKVGLITFRYTGAELALPPTSSVEAAAARLESLPAGGRTPLAEGLLLAGEVLGRERIRDPRRRPLLVVVTDGRATAGPDAVRRSRVAAGLIAARGVAAVVVDCETGRMRLGLAAALAGALHGEHVPLGDVAADALAATVRGRTVPRHGVAGSVA